MHRLITASVLGTALFTLLPVQADTLTLRSNGEVNGKVQYENDLFKINARYRSGTKSFTLSRKEVSSIELNSRDYNLGPPSPELTHNPEGAATTGHDASMKNSKQGSSKKADRPKTPRSDDLSDSATQDIVSLPDMTKLTGRLMGIQKGAVTIQTGNKTKQIETPPGTTLLIAPE